MRERDEAMAQYERLLDELAQGLHPPGTLLLETALSTAHQVSRTPVREALARLEQDGVLVRVSRGYQVRSLTLEEIADIYQVRVLLEGHGAAVAAHRRTAVDLARLRQIQQESEDTTDLAEIRRLDRAFHVALQAAWHNEAIVETAARLLVQVSVYPFRLPVSRAEAQLNINEHARILEALTASDPESARAAAAAHLDRNRDLRIATLLGEDAFAPVPGRVASGG